MYIRALKKLLHRPAMANKYDFGHVLIVGGSPGMVGAPLLAALAAMRVGAGLVTIAAPGEVCDTLDERVLEVMTLRLPNDENKAIKAIQNYCAVKKVTVVVIGSGMKSPATLLSLRLTAELALPLVLDAGALTVFKDYLDRLAQAGGKNPQIIITPHDGEYHQLTGTILPVLGEERKKIVSEFAQKTQVTTVCKGHHTLVAHRDGGIYEESAGNPGMAKAGVGDVLTGVLAGLLAQGISASDAAEFGVHIHAVAGDLLAEDETQAGIIASDIVDILPHAIQHVADEN